VTFPDHFSGSAATYAAHRPTYPPALFAWLADAAPARGHAWDCATGSGQAAVALAAHFARVTATDASAVQLAHATAHERVSYAVAPAEASGLPDASVDLVTVAQALHWFRRDAFWREARRVLVPRGVVAVWSYDDLTLDAPAADAAFQAYVRAVLGPDWPAERVLVGAGYRALELPFDELDVPAFPLERAWTLDALLGYVRSWSATARHVARTGRDPVPGLRDVLAAAWPGGDPRTPVTARWLLVVRAGRA
jgi:SAM-dependent methyltransferase